MGASQQAEGGGVDHSGGQWQRVALARAILRGSESEFPILDGPTVVLDAKAEHGILTTLGRTTAGKMALVVSHRLAPARRADRIAMTDGGRVVEVGTHRKPMRSGGLYLDMFGRQAESSVDLRRLRKDRKGPLPVSVATAMCPRLCGSVWSGWL